MNKVIPTIFALNNEEFQERFEKVIEISNSIQIDFMDGKFVKNTSIEVNIIPDLRKYKKNFEAHLMCIHPEDYIGSVVEKGFKKVIFHVEALGDLQESIKKSKEHDLEVYLAINPETELKKIVGYLHEIDGVLFLGVNPGKENQEFIEKVYFKIKELREFNKKIQIQVDGGINLKVAERLKEIGVNSLNVGSFVAKSNNPKKSLEELEKVFS